MGSRRQIVFLIELRSFKLIFLESFVHQQLPSAGEYLRLIYFLFLYCLFLNLSFYDFMGVSPFIILFFFYFFLFLSFHFKYFRLLTLKNSRHFFIGFLFWLSLNWAIPIFSFNLNFKALVLIILILSFCLIPIKCK